MTDTQNGGRDNDGGGFHWNEDGQSPSAAIIDAVAELEDTSPLELDALNDTIDAEALDEFLCRDDDTEVVVEFRYGGYWLTVYSDGEIRIRDADDPEE